jgi:hypothetical protein
MAARIDNGRVQLLTRTGLDGVVTALEACGTLCSPVVQRMKKIAYSGYRFPP